MARDLFYFFRSYRDAMDEMDDATRGHFVKALADYALDGRVPTFGNPTERMMWAIMKPNIDNNLAFADGLEAKREARREAGRKGGKTTGNAPWNKGQCQAKAKQKPSKSQAKAKQSQADAKQGAERTPENPEKSDVNGGKNGGECASATTNDSADCKVQCQAKAKQKPSKAKQIIDNRLMIIDNTPPPSTRTREEAYAEELRGNGTCVEQCARLFRITTAEVQVLMSDFAVEVSAKGTEHENASDYRRHFVDWARIHQTKITQHGNTQGNIRYGYRADNTSKAEFNAALADHYRTEELRAEHGMGGEKPDI